MKTFKDQMNNTIRLDSNPSRIVSLVPSQTELLYHLGLEDRVVGITKFCIHPKEWYHSKERVGGTKTIDRNKVVALKPDLIIGNKEENDKLNIEELAGIAPIWMSDIFNLEDAMEMISQVGELTNSKIRAQEINQKINLEFNSINTSLKNKKVLYFIWKDPDMIAGKNTFIDEMINKCGLVNLAEGKRYPNASGNEKPDYVFLSSEPYPFKDKHIEEFKEKYPNALVKLVDGEYFSWYGSRLMDAPSYFNNLLSKL